MQTLKCKWCGGETFKTTVDVCDKCWHLDYGIRHNIDMAKRMLAEIESQSNIETGNKWTKQDELEHVKYKDWKECSWFDSASVNYKTCKHLKEDNSCALKVRLGCDTVCDFEEAL
jgi:hypothetical protein